MGCDLYPVGIRTGQPLYQFLKQAGFASKAKKLLEIPVRRQRPMMCAWTTHKATCVIWIIRLVISSGVSELPDCVDVQYMDFGIQAPILRQPSLYEAASELTPLENAGCGQDVHLLNFSVWSKKVPSMNGPFSVNALTKKFILSWLIPCWAAKPRWNRLSRSCNRLITRKCRSFACQGD